MTSPSNHHVAVWLDHREARVFQIGADSFEETTLPCASHHARRHPVHDRAEKNHPEDEKRFFHDVAKALAAADEILVVGPSTAKLHFLQYVYAHDPKLEQRIVGVETMDHPTDPQLAAYARHYFHDTDRMKGLTP